MPSECVGQQPRADVDVRARVVELRLADAMPRQLGKVGAVDLHEPDVVGPRALQMRSVHGARVEVGLDTRHRDQQVGRQPVALRRLLPAGLGLQRRPAGGERCQQPGSWHRPNRRPSRGEQQRHLHGSTRDVLVDRATPFLSARRGRVRGVERRVRTGEPVRV